MTINKGHIIVILWIIFMAMLLVPAVQHGFRPIHERPLHGDINVPDAPDLNPGSWFNESYQDSMNKYLNDNTGFRPELVRINNQIHFSLFNVAKGREIVIGKKNYLYGMAYIRAATGADFIGIKEIRAKIKQVKRMQDTLTSQGKHLIILFAPGKGSFYPEYIPDQFLCDDDSTNHKYFVQEARAHHLNVFDANTWFREMKDTSQYSLYPKYGIHWSVYGYSLVLDSLESYVEIMTGKDIPDFKINDWVTSLSPRNTDNDMEQGCNLLFSLNPELLAYPIIAYEEKGKSSLKMLAIGDSFFWNMMPTCNVLFNNLHFLYYFREDHDVAKHSKSTIEESYDLLKKIEETDIVMLVITDAQLPRFAWGFFDAFDNAISNPTTR